MDISQRGRVDLSSFKQLLSSYRSWGHAGAQLLECVECGDRTLYGIRLRNPSDLYKAIMCHPEPERDIASYPGKRYLPREKDTVCVVWEEGRGLPRRRIHVALEAGNTVGSLKAKIRAVMRGPKVIPPGRLPLSLLPVSPPSLTRAPPRSRPGGSN